MINSFGYAAESGKSPLAPFKFTRRDPKEHDVVIDIMYCGVCHSDIHQARDEWGNSRFPMVPGHEIVGRVSKVGPRVKNVREGDLAAVGCFIDSCRVCDPCKNGLEPYCESGVTATYNSFDKEMNQPHHGGYSNNIVVREEFVLKVSPKLDLARVAPLLCAGITTYSPMRHWKVKKGQKVGVVGLGGLGHMAVKFAHSFGAHTVVLTHSPGKKEDALKLGADEVVVTKNQEEMGKHSDSFNFIIDTVSAPHNINDYLGLLKLDGVLCIVGVPTESHKVEPFYLIGGRRSLVGSLVGGIPETQEMLDYCAEHNILSDVEIIPIQKINEAYERMLKSDVKYRFVIDMKSLS